MPKKSEVQESISNLSMGLIEHGPTLLQTHSFPVYKKNIDQRDPPFAPTEFTPSAIAILLISSGLDYQPRAELSRAAELRPKALLRKLKGSERTKSLRLPLVSSRISYPDAVTCVLVLHRFLNLLERKYGNPYAWVGNFFVRNDPAGFFKDTNKARLSVSMENWAAAFFESLSKDDQQRARKRLGRNFSTYLHKALPRLRFGRGTVSDITRVMQNPPKAAFLHKTPPWPI